MPSLDATIIYHGGMIADLISLIDDHEERILETKSMVLSMLTESPHSLEEITSKVMQVKKIPDDLIAYMLTKIPIQAYIAELEREGTIEVKVADGVNRAYVINKSTLSERCCIITTMVELE